MVDLTRIPLAFIEARHRLTWAEVQLGFVQGWLSRGEVVEFAASKLEEGEDGVAVVELAGAVRAHANDVVDLIASVVRPVPVPNPESIRLTWMRLFMAWTWEHRESVAEPLAWAEEIYASFGYPAEIRHLIRYEPPGPGKVPGGESGLMAAWGEYVAGISA